LVSINAVSVRHVLPVAWMRIERPAGRIRKAQLNAAYYLDQSDPEVPLLVFDVVLGPRDAGSVAAGTEPMLRLAAVRTVRSTPLSTPAARRPDGNAAGPCRWSDSCFQHETPPASIGCVQPPSSPRKFLWCGEICGISVSTCPQITQMRADSERTGGLSEPGVLLAGQTSPSAPRRRPDWWPSLVT